MMDSVLSDCPKFDAARAWALVFRSTDPFGWPFTPAMGSGRVIFPTDGCHLSREQFDALARVAAMYGESDCYLAVVEGHANINGGQDERIFMLDLADYECYVRLHLTLENAIYSMTGKWGMLISHEMHALLAGDVNFVSAFNAIEKSADAEWGSFLDQWPDEQHESWISDINLHITQPG